MPVWWVSAATGATFTDGVRQVASGNTGFAVQGRHLHPTCHAYPEWRHPRAGQRRRHAIEAEGVGFEPTRNIATPGVA
jgi:hypothetical protein